MNLYPGGNRSIIRCHRRKQPIENCLRTCLKKRIIPSASYDGRKQEFANVRQGKLTINEYYRKFSDLPRPIQILLLF